MLQSLSARLGIIRGSDLAQANRETYPKGINFILWLLAEIAIAATDLAEVLGMAIGIQLLTGLPLIWGVSITVLGYFPVIVFTKAWYAQNGSIYHCTDCDYRMFASSSILYCPATVI
jgi:manganese transport protein